MLYLDLGLHRLRKVDDRRVVPAAEPALEDEALTELHRTDGRPHRSPSGNLGEPAGVVRRLPGRRPPRVVPPATVDGPVGVHVLGLVASAVAVRPLAVELQLRVRDGHGRYLHCAYVCVAHRISPSILSALVRPRAMSFALEEASYCRTTRMLLVVVFPCLGIIDAIVDAYGSR